jgi:transcriptional regulator with XRE-family HTH domain/KaiC/GvpD/RAD55 family RecA-like ATPase
LEGSWSDLKFSNQTTGQISSGIAYLDHLLGFFKTGDNVIWEVEAGTYVEIFLQRFIESSLKRGYQVVYVSFNVSPSTLAGNLKRLSGLENLTLVDCFTSGKGNDDPLFVQFYEKEKEKFAGKVIRVESPRDLSQFRAALDRIEIEKGAGVKYVFDSLTGMQDLWGDETATNKFFTYSCPRLYELQTVAYWILEKDAHTASFKANLRHITQVVIELGREDGELFLKVTKLKGSSSRSVLLPKRYEVWDQKVVFPSIGGRRPGNLGDKIKALRIGMGLTQKELAARINLTPSFISQLEKNLISPSLDSLLKLSYELHTPPVHFLEEGEERPVSRMVVKPGERQEVHLKEKKGTEVKLQLLVSEVPNRRMEAYLVTFRKRATVKGHLFNHKGDEFSFVMEGELEVELRGEKHLLRPGDSLYLETAVPSKWTSVGKGDAVLLWVLSPPRERG